jgi:hypothetical protein
MITTPYMLRQPCELPSAVLTQVELLKCIHSNPGQKKMKNLVHLPDVWSYLNCCGISTATITCEGQFPDKGKE